MIYYRDHPVENALVKNRKKEEPTPNLGVRLLDDVLLVLSQVMVNDESYDSLYKSARVSKQWSRIFIPVLWKNPTLILRASRKNYDKRLLSLFETLLSGFNDSEAILSGLIIERDFKSPLYDYTRYIRVFDADLFRTGIFKLHRNALTFSSERTCTALEKKITDAMQHMMQRQGNRIDEVVLRLSTGLLAKTDLWWDILLQSNRDMFRNFRVLEIQITPSLVLWKSRFLSLPAVVKKVHTVWLRCRIVVDKSRGLYKEILKVIKSLSPIRIHFVRISFDFRDSSTKKSIKHACSELSCDEVIFDSADKFKL